MRDKILIIGPGKKFLSGITYYTISLANAFSKENKVNVITLRNLVPKFLFPGAKRVGKKISSFNFEKKIKVYDGIDWYLFPSIFSAHKLIKDMDYIILQWWTSASAHTYLLLKIANKLFYNKKIIFEMHEVLDVMEQGFFPLKIYSKIMAKLLFGKTEKYVVHSKQDKAEVIKAYNINPEKIFVIPHGSYDHYKGNCKIDSDPNKIKILFFGLIRPYKGVEYLIKAFENIKNEKYELIIAGESWEGYNIKKLVEGSTKKDKIRLINKYITDEEVNNLFNQADVLVLPYLRASQSGAAHIAISYGIPVIVSKVGGLIESMGSYKGTIFIKPKSIKDITNAIYKLKKGKRFENPHPWSKTINKYKEVLK
jgi:glycosyltransferase involved in cell wall biosynthesis